MAGSGGGGGGDTVVIQGPSFLRQLANYTWLTMAQIVMTLGLLYMLLAQGRRAARSFIRRIDNRSAFVDFMGAVQERFSTYVRALTAINLCVGALTALAMLLLGMPNPVMWGLLAFFLNFLPFVGPLAMLPILIFISMLFWTWCWGMPGAFLAAPIAVFAKLVYDFLIGQPADLARSEAAAESK